MRLVVQLQDPRPGERQVDAFFVIAGRTVVGLLAQSGDVPPPVAAERRLLTLLYSRAEAHKL